MKQKIDQAVVTVYVLRSYVIFLIISVLSFWATISKFGSNEECGPALGFMFLLSCFILAPLNSLFVLISYLTNFYRPLLTNYKWLTAESIIYLLCIYLLDLGRYFGLLDILIPYLGISLIILLIKFCNHLIKFQK